MHMINKTDTEDTGQETYVWEMYNSRCWDFFPVGDCFPETVWLRWDHKLTLTWF